MLPPRASCHGNNFPSPICRILQTAAKHVLTAEICYIVLIWSMFRLLDIGKNVQLSPDSQSDSMDSKHGAHSNRRYPNFNRQFPRHYLSPLKMSQSTTLENVSPAGIPALNTLDLLGISLTSRTAHRLPPLGRIRSPPFATDYAGV